MNKFPLLRAKIVEGVYSLYKNVVGLDAGYPLPDEGISVRQSSIAEDVYCIIIVICSKLCDACSARNKFNPISTTSLIL